MSISNFFNSQMQNWRAGAEKKLTQDTTNSETQGQDLKSDMLKILLCQGTTIIFQGIYNLRAPSCLNMGLHIAPNSLYFSFLCLCLASAFSFGLLGSSILYLFIVIYLFFGMSDISIMNFNPEVVNKKCFGWFLSQGQIRSIGV